MVLFDNVPTWNTFNQGRIGGMQVPFQPFGQPFGFSGMGMQGPMTSSGSSGFNPTGWQDIRKLFESGVDKWANSSTSRPRTTFGFSDSPFINNAMQATSPLTSEIRQGMHEGFNEMMGLPKQGLKSMLKQGLKSLLFGG